MRAFAIAPLMVAALAIAACGSSDGSDSARRPDPKHQPPALARTALVHVEAHYSETKKGEATGFVYDAKNGLVLTAGHAVEAAPNIHVIFGNGLSLNGRLVGRAQCHDLAVLKVDPSATHLHAIVWGGPARLGQRVHSLTYFAKSEGSYHDGMTMEEARGTVAMVDHSAVLTRLLPTFDGLIGHQTPLSDVSAGSPLLDDSGRVIGINTLSGRKYGSGSPPGVNYAQSARTVQGLLDQLVPGERAVFSGWSAEHVCHTQMNQLAGLPRNTSHQHEAHFHSMDEPATAGGMDEHSSSGTGTETHGH